jgi:peptidoglycan/LPS O-acetylase OafA/YrhL
MLSLVQVGNIQPLVVAMLGFGISRRSGPLWVGISASLKAVPVVWALVYLARREWPRLLGALAVAALLSATFLLHDRTGYVTDPGRSGMSLYYNFGPTAWLLGAGLCGAVALYLAWRRSEWLWPALAVAAIFIAPRSHITYTTFLAVGLLNGVRDRIRES